MRLPYTVHLKEFIFIAMQDKRVKNIIDDWPVESEFVAKTLVDHFYQLGLFEVLPLKGTEMVMNNILFQLEHSPELKKLIRKGQREAFE